MTNKLLIQRIQDNDGDWYWIPAHMKDDFLSDCEAIEGKDYMEDPDSFDKFNDSYSPYATGGCQNNVPEMFQNDN